jgi:hypothetical protein
MGDAYISQTIEGVFATPGDRLDMLEDIVRLALIEQGAKHSEALRRQRQARETQSQANLTDL